MSGNILIIDEKHTVLIFQFYSGCSLHPFRKFIQACCIQYWRIVAIASFGRHFAKGLDWRWNKSSFMRYGVNFFRQPIRLQTRSSGEGSPCMAVHIIYKCGMGYLSGKGNLFWRGKYHVMSRSCPSEITVARTKNENSLYSRVAIVCGFSYMVD